jgi:hypothetical protein
MEPSYEVTNLNQKNIFLKKDFSFNVIYHPKLDKVHGNKYNDNEVNKHNKTMYMYKKNISRLIQEISFYLRVLIPTNGLMATS